MGNLYSAITEEAKQFKELAKDNDPQTPLATPSPCDEENNARFLKGKGLFDPRSPSQGVSRTPLEIEERNKRLEKARINNLLINKENNSLNVANDEATELVTTPTGAPGKDTLSVFDPRSPNPEISRTPIALNSNNAPISRKMFQNQNQ